MPSSELMDVVVVGVVVIVVVVVEGHTSFYKYKKYTNIREVTRKVIKPTIKPISRVLMLVF